jgi:hypothetical protein
METSPLKSLNILERPLEKPELQEALGAAAVEGVEEELGETGWLSRGAVS